MKSPPSLILASTSAYRRELLARLRLPFSCKAPGVDESPRKGERPVDLAVRLARAKASAVALEAADAWVIGSDQVALTTGPDGELILGKPGNQERSIEQLTRCSGATITFFTAVAVVRHNGRAAHEFLDTTHVVFRTLDAATITRYVSAETPYDCAGSFKSEGLGVSLCESIDSGDPTALVGLPLIGLSRVLREVGFSIP